MVLIRLGVLIPLLWDVTTVEMAEAVEENVSGWRNPNCVSQLQVKSYLGILPL